ncbi:alpha-beta hydrolase superfamily lysophospholipase [Sagittula marina]|uniref:Alpha-beta hydrolase superfamily lysophospholipase n=1 Tax=Sagittula marina TaxID=943940 RepID=A0A7W6GRA3_9RHOB|nr:alpha/beta fold hydrolase [Sagittula marina]MBB3984695.1 alpha-beta hydrolase superfamily lysophospholipase [Sagittula marina]
MFDSYVQEAMRRGRCLPERRIRLEAQDGLTLFAGVFETQARAAADRVVILLHGAGANMNVGYLDLARDIHTHSGAVVLVPDVRGHGMSQGPRGYAPDRACVWDDLDLWIARAGALWPDADITLLGHSAGAAQILNRVTEHGAPLAKSVQRFIALAPYFASTARLRAQSGRDLDEFNLPQFSVRRGVVERSDDCPEPRVVNFNFPPEAARWCNLVPGYTAEMSAALSPRDIDRQLAALPLPTVVLAAKGDELFPVEGLRRLVLESGNALIRFDTVPHAHLTCLFHAGPRIAEALTALEDAA